ncbi:uncharacterized protein BDR25DRAFT_341509 [Lindgomyces ingoldianus]|uniref:Uncharacterized protein n=1 Tax=Lindgomyces ingoldianus TaxID=673940 RepID=A0ACB6R586_9PLEO|nr:uncharacterized protein BDR25DRAFT_341509 [Lindgomyces ingoldianus]KAF2473452.1 hypothetical protein BDR25DRAFT_341509 [Lindgomyces ingoldianus]
MADIALGAIGLLPILIRTISSFQTIHNGIKIANKCIEHLDIIAIDWKIQRGRFLNECVLLLMESGEEELVGRAMVADLLHTSWTNSALATSFSTCLGDSYELCIEIMKRFDTISKKLKKILTGFETVRSKKIKGESYKITYRRLYQSIRFAFDKEELEKQIRLLRHKNGDLESLRAQIKSFHCQSLPRGLTSYHKPMPPYFCEVQRISTEAHRALIASFSCSDTSHDEHTALIALDVDYGNETRLEMAISYMSSSGIAPSMDPPVKFLLRSESIEESQESLRTVNSKRQSNHSLKCHLSIAPAEEPHSQPREHAEEPRKKRRKVTFARLPERHQKTLQEAVSKIEEPDTTLNLAALSSVCQFLRQKCNRSGKAKAKALSTHFALLRLSEEAQYVFYLSSHGYISPNLVNQGPFTPVPLTDYLDNHFQGEVSVVQQYKLALKLAQAVLQFQSTPWFEEEWDMRQLLVLPEADDAADDLRVYINSKLTKTKSNPSQIEPITSLNRQKAHRPANNVKVPLSTAQRRGVDNITLFCLGVALLEIAHWKPISSLREDYDDDSIDTARRMANGNSLLGKWYDETIRKCLRCDFAVGADLRRLELQKAVYGEVICPLEDLIERLDNLSL